MKKLLMVLLAILMVVGVSVPTASAYHAWWHWPPFTPDYYPPPAYPPAYPPTAYAPPSPPHSCYTQSGYWSQVPYTNEYGFTSYQSVWVPARTVCS